MKKVIPALFVAFVAVLLEGCIATIPVRNVHHYHRAAPVYVVPPAYPRYIPPPPVYIPRHRYYR